MNDLESFAVAFLIVWGGLAAYLAWLHTRIARLERKQG